MADQNRVQNDRRLITQTDIKVSDNNQIYLPAEYVAELGFPSAKTDTRRGAKVVWYYHERHQKAVLGDDDVDRSSLEDCGARRLSNVSNDELDAGDVDGARVVVSDKLPDELYEQLTDRCVVLKPIDRNSSSNLKSTLVSVYPAEAYHQADLPNVERTMQKVVYDNGTIEAGTKEEHCNLA